MSSCCRCAKLPPVQNRLVEASLYVDLMSISGTKRLIEQGSRHRLNGKAWNKRWVISWFCQLTPDLFLSRNSRYADSHQPTAGESPRQLSPDWEKRPPSTECGPSSWEMALWSGVTCKSVLCTTAHGVLVVTMSLAAVGVPWSVRVTSFCLAAMLHSQFAVKLGGVANK